MGSNSRKHFDKGLSEYGKKPRKYEAREKRHSLAKDSISDNLESYEKGIECPCGCGHYEACNDYLEVPYRRPKPKGKRRKKDTKRWCRGKEGREHNFILIKEDYTWWHVSLWKCELCGRKDYRRPVGDKYE